MMIRIIDHCKKFKPVEENGKYYMEGDNRKVDVTPYRLELRRYVFFDWIPGEKIYLDGNFNSEYEVTRIVERGEDWAVLYVSRGEGILYIGNEQFSIHCSTSGSSLEVKQLCKLSKPRGRRLVWGGNPSFLFIVVILFNGEIWNYIEI